VNSHEICSPAKQEEQELVSAKQEEEEELVSAKQELVYNCSEEDCLLVHADFHQLH
jgi:hypothetical protein